MSFNILSAVTLNNGISMPVFGLGTWRSNPGQVRTAVFEALKDGYRHLDCAAIYENQNEVAQGIADAVSQGICTREDIFIVSKLWNTEHAPEDVRAACEQTINELGVGYLDQYLIHWPAAFVKRGTLWPKTAEGYHEAKDTSILDTWRAMEDLVAAGLVRSIGVSNFSVEEVQLILEGGRIKPVVNQVECHPYLIQEELRTYLRSHDIHIVAYCPLGNINPGKEGNVTPLDEVVVQEMAVRYGKTPAQILLRWGLQKGNIIIPKSVTPARILENSQIFDFELTTEDLEALSHFPQRRMVNPAFRLNNTRVFSA